MLKFIKHHMETIMGIEFYPVLSFSIFFLFFLVLLVYVFRMDREERLSLSAIPLTDGSETLNKNNNGDAGN